MSCDPFSLRATDDASEEVDMSAPEGADTQVSERVNGKAWKEAIKHPAKDSVTPGPCRSSDDGAVGICVGNEFEPASESEDNRSFFDRLTFTSFLQMLLAH